MSLFEKEFKDGYLKYHNRPIPVNSLDPRVFYYPPEGGQPILQPEIKVQIFNDIDSINTTQAEYNQSLVEDYYIIGPILKQGSSDTCYLNVIVKISTSNLTDVTKERVLMCLKTINGRLATGTQHPIYYTPTIRDIDNEQYSAIYHPYTEKWIKEPRYLGEKVKFEDLHKEPISIRQKRKASPLKGLKKLGKI